MMLNLKILFLGMKIREVTVLGHSASNDQGSICGLISAVVRMTW